MAAVKVGINGFGRIGRLVFRQLLDNNEVEVVAINDLTDANMLAQLLKYDSVHGKLDREVTVIDANFVVDSKEVIVKSVRGAANIRWDDLGVEIVFESTGLIFDRDGSQKHLDAGAKKVVIS